MKKAIRNSLIGLAALTIVGCSTVPTNTQSLKNAPTKYSGFNYTTDQLNLDGKRYFVLALPEGKSVAYEGAIIPEGFSLDFYAVPQNNHSKRTENGTVTVGSDELYGFVHTKKDGTNIVLNTSSLVRSSLELSEQGLESRLETRGTVARERRRRGSEVVQGTKIMDKFYHLFNTSEDNSASTFRRENYSLMPVREISPYTLETTKNGKTTTETGLRGYPFAMVPITLVDTPKVETSVIKPTITNEVKTVTTSARTVE